MMLGTHDAVVSVMAKLTKTAEQQARERVAVRGDALAECEARREERKEQTLPSPDN